MPKQSSKPKHESKKKLISIIMPTYNRKYCIMNAINSVLAQNTQFFDFEIIVVDDGSTDKTSDLFRGKNPKIKYYRLKKNSGVNVARNHALMHARGEYVLLLDTDDLISKDAFKIIKKYEKSLTEINFFGTKEITTNKKMSFISKTGRYSYRDWLEGEKIKGEFLSVMKKEVFKQDKFDEERFCFETFFWNRVIKKYGASAFDESLRIYSFGQENRISKTLQDPAKALKRYSDYVEYLRRFEKDYRDYKLKKQLSTIYFITGYYACLSGKMREGRDYFRKANKEKTSIKTLAGIALSFLGKSVFIRLAGIIASKS